jgi:hypothetical protein
MMWHKKLGHMSEKGLKVLSDQKLLPGLTKVTLPFCEHCVTSKQHRLKFGTSTTKSKCILDLIHSDVWQAPVVSLGGARYFVSFIDDFSRRCWVYPIKRKADVAVHNGIYSTAKWSGRADEQNSIRKNESNVEGCRSRKVILGRSSQYRLLCDKSISINCN